MSKIAKALEKSKENRSQGQTTDTLPATRPRVDQNQEQEVRPQYSQTKVIPLSETHLEEHRIRPYLSDPSAIDQYDLLRTQVLQRTRNKRWNTIMVTSVIPSEGKTLTAINLALSISREVHQTALLVDINLRAPKIHDYLGLTVEQGLADYLLHDTPLTDLFLNPGMEKVVVLPAGKPLKGSIDILGSPKMKALVQELKNRYPERYVIFDCPHLLNLPDALIFSTYVDGIVLVVEAGRTSRKDVQSAMELLQDKNVLGLVFNKVTC
ncbi:polysaccharide biosynthesis tyrosine autokinase [Desulfovulcanus sp.]